MTQTLMFISWLCFISRRVLPPCDNSIFCRDDCLTCFFQYQLHLLFGPSKEIWSYFSSLFFLQVTNSLPPVYSGRCMPYIRVSLHGDSLWNSASMLIRTENVSVLKSDLKGKRSSADVAIRLKKPSFGCEKAAWEKASEERAYSTIISLWCCDVSSPSARMTSCKVIS